MSGYQVGPETFVTLCFQVLDAEGEEASPPEVVGVVFGMGGLLPSIDRAIEGLTAGQTATVVLPPHQAYGERNPSAILEVDRSEFPAEVAPGDRFDVENEDGGLLVVQVLDVGDDRVVVDTNHPLADQKVQIRLEIREVRPATREEIAASEALLDEDSSYIRPGGSVIPAQSLIRGRARG